MGMIFVFSISIINNSANEIRVLHIRNKRRK